MTRIARAGALLALAFLTALALAGPSSAKKKPDGRGNGAQARLVLPKAWAKQHKAKRAKADPDRDGLVNWGEYRSHTKPKRADSDRDGIGDAREDYDGDGLDNGSELDAGTDPGRRDTDRDGTLDGDENAGTVAAFDGTTLTIALAGGGTLTGVVDEASELGCEDELVADDELEPDDEDEDLDDSSVTARLAEQGDEDDADDEEWFEDDFSGCLAEIEPGTPVREAEVEDGVFVVLELGR